MVARRIVFRVRQNLDSLSFNNKWLSVCPHPYFVQLVHCLLIFWNKNKHAGKCFPDVTEVKKGTVQVLSGIIEIDFEEYIEQLKVEGVGRERSVLSRGFKNVSVEIK